MSVLRLTFALAVGVAGRDAIAQPPPVAPTPAYAPALPPAPAGFSWVQSAEARASFLRPDGWHLKTQFGSGTTAVFITREEIAPPENRFKVGLSVNVIRQVPEKTKLSPSEFARKHREDSRAGLGAREEADAAAGELRLVAHTVADPASGVTVRHVFVANDRTGTLTWMMLEAPTAEWAAVVRHAAVMTQVFVVDDEL